MSSLQELLERVEKATGSDREIDADLALAIGIVPAGFVRAQDGMFCEEYLKANDLPYGLMCGKIFACPPYTTSIDAAVGLVERMLPGWRIDLTCHGNEAFVHLFDRDLGHPWCKQISAKSSIGATTAHDLGQTSRQSLWTLALIAALLRAMIVKEKE